MFEIGIDGTELMETGRGDERKNTTISMIEILLTRTVESKRELRLYMFELNVQI